MLEELRVDMVPESTRDVAQREDLVAGQVGEDEVQQVGKALGVEGVIHGDACDGP